MDHAPHRTGRAAAAFTRLNERYIRYCAYCLAISTAIHIVYILFGQGPPSRPYRYDEEAIQLVEIPDEIDIPPPPPEVERPEIPAIPVEPEVSSDAETPTEPLPPTTLNPFAPPVAVPPPPPEETFVAFDTPPQRVEVVEPVYPEIARELHAQGTVLVQVTVDETGKVIDAVVVESTTIEALEQAALKAARASQFRPAKQRDVPVKARIVIPFRFVLKSR
jgi:protein TonB